MNATISIQKKGFLALKFARDDLSWVKKNIGRLHD